MTLSQFLKKHNIDPSTVTGRVPPDKRIPVGHYLTYGSPAYKPKRLLGDGRITPHRDLNYYDNRIDICAQHLYKNRPQRGEISYNRITLLIVQDVIGLLLIYINDMKTPIASVFFNY